MTVTNSPDGQIIKTDTLGRRRTSAQRRESLLAEFDRSGVSAVKFAELTGLKYQTLATWLQKRRRQGQPAVKRAEPVRWLEALVEQAPGLGGQPQPALVVELPSGTRLTIRDGQQALLAAALLRALAQPC